MRDLLGLLPEGDFGFRLTLRRGDLAEFFAPTSAHEVLLETRRKYLAESPDDYAILRDEGQVAWEEFCALVSTWYGRSVPADPVLTGGVVEPDVLILTRDREGTFRLRGGVVVFPSHWALAHKLDQTLLEIHGVVPGLNAAIGPAINRYLDKLKPGFSAGRPNWGLAATDALNLHPGVHPPRLTAELDLDHMWLRIEDQILSPLPNTGALLFGIRIERICLAEVLQDERVRRRFHHILVTMPPAVAAYKGLTEVLPKLRSATR